MFENLTSLTFHVRGGFAGIDEKLTIALGQVTLAVKGHIGDNTAPVSHDEMTHLIDILEEANLPRLKWHFGPSHAMDALSQTLTVTVGTGKEKKSYRVAGGNAKSPEGYRAVVSYLRDLQNDKFSSPR